MTTRGSLDAAAVPSASALSETARAKVNLSLRVVGRRLDGYHDLESVVAFADCADRLDFVPGSALTLQASGPLAEGLKLYYGWFLANQGSLPESAIEGVAASN